MLKNRFKNYFFVKIPICIFIIILLTELFAFSLSEFSSIRHGLDRKVQELEMKKKYENVELILFGDSVTKEIVDDYSLLPDKNILNFTTNKASGMLGVLLLYNKYRLSNFSPKKILISSTPGFLSFIPEGGTKKLYIDSVFNDVGDKDIIKNFYIAKDIKQSNIFNIKYINENLNLAINNLSESIVYPFINFCGFVDSKDSLFAGSKNVLKKEELLEMYKNEEKKFVSNKPLKFDNNTDIFFTSHSRKIMKNFFQVLKKDNVKLYIAWAPMRKSYYEKIYLNSELKEYESVIKSIAAEEKLEIYFYDFSQYSNFPDVAFREEDHFKTGYWTSYYAYILQDYMFNILEKN